MLQWESGEHSCQRTPERQESFQPASIGDSARDAHDEVQLSNAVQDFAGKISSTWQGWRTTLCPARLELEDASSLPARMEELAAISI